MSVDQTDLGLRYNTGKPKLSMVPLALEEAAARAYMYGAEKYARDNWRKGLKVSEILDSLLRHTKALCEGELKDPESKLLHSDHIAANAGFLAHFIKTDFNDMPFRTIEDEEHHDI